MKKFLKVFLIIFILGTASALAYVGSKYAYSIKHKENIDMNEKINFKDMIDSGEVRNKDYSNSIFFPYYELLNDDQKKLYNELIDGINNYQEEVIPSMEINKDLVTDVFYAVLYEHPELFWLGNAYSSEFYEDSLIVTSIKIKYNDTVKDIENAKKKFDNEVNKIINEVKNYKYDYEKEKYVHDILIKMIKYNKDAISNQSAYDALVNKEAVCAGYAKAFQLIMNKLGIPTYYITGISTENHAWNLIELEDGFYNIDLTFDDQEDRIIYKYFNIPEGLIKKDHIRTEQSLKIVEADGINILTFILH